MLTEQEIQASLPDRFGGAQLPFLGEKISGKVRDNYRMNGKRILVVTDRLSAFDRILGLVPFKGQVLNQLAAYWFDQTQDIIPNHLLEIPDPNVTVARECRPLPVEVIVRGYISGVTKTSLWYQYEKGERRIYGIDFPDGLQKNDPLPEPVITPTTKAAGGGHDERITGEEIVARGLVTRERWEQICDCAVALFKRGQQVARRGGLILVDTKYEFGLSPDGELLLIDEIHTPDSSRFWIAGSYEQRREDGLEPENFDKEFIRLRYAEQGYRGTGEPMPLADELAVAAAQRYIRSYEMLVGERFEPGHHPVASRVEDTLRRWCDGTSSRVVATP